MASNRMAGRLLGLEINGDFISCETSCDFNFDTELRPASPQAAGRWKEVIQGVRSWSVGVNAAMLLNMAGTTSIQTILNAWLTGAKMGVKFAVRNPSLPNFIISGNAVVQNGAINGAVGSMASWNVVLVGDGPIEGEVNSNVVYVLATDGNGDELVEDGNNNLIEAAAGTGKDIAVVYSIEAGDDPTTLNGIIVYKNGSQETILYSGTGALPNGTFKEGDTIVASQFALPMFRWAPGSTARLTVKADGVTIYTGLVSDQNPIDLQQNTAFVIPVGVSAIEIISTGANASLNYFTKDVQLNSNVAANDWSVTVTDNLEAGLGILDLKPSPGTTFFPFNVKGTTGNLTVTLNNLKATDVTYTLIGEGGYLKTGTIVAGGSVSYSDVTKGGLLVEVSDI